MDRSEPPRGGSDRFGSRDDRGHADRDDRGGYGGRGGYRGKLLVI